MGNSQTFSDLTDEEVSTIVRADQATELIKLWTASESGSERRLRAAYFPTNLIDDDFFPAISEWIIQQSKVRSWATIEDQIREAFPKADPDDIRTLSRALSVLACDPSRTVMSRVAAALTITAFDTQEINESMILFALSLRQELRTPVLLKLHIRLQTETDWDLVIRVLQSSEETIVISNVLQLWRILQSKAATDNEVSEAFSALRQGRFIPPFLVEEGNRDLNRLNSSTGLPVRYAASANVFRISA